MPTLKHGNFVCESCYKQHKWRAEWAGKKAKCPCGATLTVPPEPTEPEILYDFAMPDTPQPVKSMTVYQNIVAQPYAADGKKIVGYASGASDAKDRSTVLDKIYSPGRDLYAPIILLAAGLVLYALRIIYLGNVSAAVVGQVSLVLAAMMIVKTFVLVGVAFMAATLFGAHFGTFWTTVLKLAAIIVFADFAVAWIDHFIGTLGAVGGRRSAIRVIGLMLLIEAGIIAVASYYLFDIDGDDIFKISAAMAVASRVVTIVLLTMLS